MIEREITEAVADVDWNNDRDVVLTIWDKRRHPHRRTFTRDEARELGADLIAVANEAESASGERTRPESAGFDTDGPIGKDCQDGKHAACIGDAWSVRDDKPAVCSCPCHPAVLAGKATS